MLFNLHEESCVKNKRVPRVYITHEKFPPRLLRTLACRDIFEASSSSEDVPSSQGRSHTLSGNIFLHGRIRLFFTS